MNKPVAFDLHEDEWQLWRDLGFRDWSWGSSVPPNQGWRQVIIPAESAEQFRMWQILRDWHCDYFDQLWHTYQAEHICLETPAPVAESGDSHPVTVQAPIQQQVCCDHVASSGDDKLG